MAFEVSGYLLFANLGVGTSIVESVDIEMDTSALDLEVLSNTVDVEVIAPVVDLEVLGLTDVEILETSDVEILPPPIDIEVGCYTEGIDETTGNGFDDGFDSGFK